MTRSKALSSLRLHPAFLVLALALAGIWGEWKARPIIPVSAHAIPAAQVRSSQAKSAEMTLSARSAPLFHERFQALAEQLNQPTQEAQALDQAVEQLGRDLPRREGLHLVDLALHPGSPTARFLAVTLLSGRPEEFSAELERIAQAPSPLFSSKPVADSIESVQFRFERALRTQALMALDQLNSRGQSELAFFQTLANTHPDAFVRRAAHLGARGAILGKSLLQEYLQKAF